MLSHCQQHCKWNRTTNLEQNYGGLAQWLGNWDVAPFQSQDSFGWKQKFCSESTTILTRRSIGGKAKMMTLQKEDLQMDRMHLDFCFIRLKKNI